VGVLDTGILKTHPDFGDRVLLTKDFISSYADNDSNDGQGHGTHCAGTIGGSNTSGRAIGVAPEASFVIGKIFNDSGSTTMSAILNAMQWIADPDSNPATDDAPRVVSNSWGGGQGTVQSEKPRWTAVQTWRDLGIVPVFAAGNSGPSMGTMSVPGGYPHSFAVGATNKNDGIASFSSRGPIQWEGFGSVIKPDISAPGVDVYSAKHTGGYTVMSGTSMATPHVAGVVALMLQANPDLSVDRIESILMETSLDLGAEGKDSVFGQGRMDALRAVEIALKGGNLLANLDFSSHQQVVTMRFEPGNVVAKSKDGVLKASLAEGKYAFTASAFGYLPISGEISIKAKETVEMKLKFAESPSFSTRFMLKDSSSVALAGRITFLDAPLQPVTVGMEGTEVKIPGGIYSVRVYSKGYRSKVETLTVTQNSEFSYGMQDLPAVLLVDDEPLTHEKYYQEALQSLNQEFDMVEKSVSLDDALGYKTIVWFTGAVSSDVLNDQEMETLTEYVKSGGHLVLSGQDIGYALKQKSFYTDVVGAKYLKDTASSKNVSGLDLSFVLDGSESANNQKYPDVIASNGADVIFTYGDSEGAGTRNKRGEGVVTYLGFGFEGINTAESRKQVMSQLLNSGLTQTRSYLSRLHRAHQQSMDSWEILARQAKHIQLETEEALSVMEALGNSEAFRPVLHLLPKSE
ncbi:MAG: S8 family serine peptidase, partial [Candidatus Cloacimonetes bacterium]|nr:S8 family serine peptidase [Candidatus Cloacimonadota bacterium]